MTEGKDENILRAVESIEIDNSAQRRMYENILKKAERKNRILRILRIVKPAVSAAACVCLVIAAALILKAGVDNSDSFSGGMSMMKSSSADAGAAEYTVKPGADTITFHIHDGEQEAASEDEAYTYDDGAADMAAGNASADGTAAITSVFDFNVEGAEGVNETAAVHAGMAGISPENAEPADVDASPSASDSRQHSDTDGAEAESVFADSAEGTVPEEEISVTLPDNTEYVSYSVSEIAAASGFASGSANEAASAPASVLINSGFTYREHLYTVTVYPFSEMTGTTGVVYEEIGKYSDSNAVLYYIESNGEASFQVCWSSEKYRFLLANSDGANREEMIEVSTEIIVNNR